jgi:geranylgeranyl diphosphate synthase type II
VKIETYLKTQSRKIDKALLGFLPRKSEHPKALHEAMHYAVMGAGKRIRPILTLAACRAVGGSEGDAMAAACAIEFIHNYSLIHDDLPCMDDDDFRRGKPTCHKKYGQDIALLAGDALLTLAFGVLTEPEKVETKKLVIPERFSRGSNETIGRFPPKDCGNDMRGCKADLFRRLTSASWIAEAIGSRGMVGGQVLDLEFQNKELDLPTLEFINTKKTGSLIAVSLKVGAYLGGGTSKQVEALFSYGKHLGFLFQIVDDILDQEGYAKIIGAAQAKKEALRLTQRAKGYLEPFGGPGLFLREIANFVSSRKN